MRLLRLLLPIAVLSSTPSRASADDGANEPPEEIDELDHGQPTPLGYTPVKRYRKGLLIGGGATFAAGYGGAMLLVVASRGENSDPLPIPVAGPFILLAQTAGDGNDTMHKPILLVLGAAQVSGAILLVLGLTAKKTVYVRNDLVGSMTLTPMAGDGTAGMLLSGRF